MKKILLTDVDGTFLDFAPAYFAYMESKGWVLPEFNPAKRLYVSMGMEPDASDDYVCDFSESDFGANLQAYPDAVRYLERFKRDGWLIVAISKWHNSPKAIANREYNIEKHFGKGLFDKIHCIGLKSNKYPFLENYIKNSSYDVRYWVEDHVEYASMGADLGANSFLLNRPDNQQKWEGLNVFRVNNWLEIYKHSLRVNNQT